jgi:hypothetical protein
MSKAKMNRMKEWVLTDMYQQLIAMPLWLHSAFGDLKTNDVLSKDSVQIKLINYLVLKTMDKCPYYDSDYRHNWSIKDYIPVFKNALKVIEPNI